MKRAFPTLLLLILLLAAAFDSAATTRYVDLNNPSPVAPFLSWSTAATNIQDAIDTASAGDQVLVTNGVYQTGGRVVFGALTNRVVVDKPLLIQSVNGPGVTVIQGHQVPGTTNGSSAVRCVWLTNGATLAGFTITKGATRFSGDASKEASGGGVWCASTSVVVSNCVLTANAAAYYGGGAYFGTLNNCTLSNCLMINTDTNQGGGAYFSTLNNCTLTGNSAGYGGGAYSSALSNCTLTANSASAQGGGAFLGTLSNCVLTANSASKNGGGTYTSTLNNCVLATNSASLSGGGAYASSLNNCQLTANSGCGAYNSTLNNCTLTANSGGGAYFGVLSNCVLTANFATSGGGANSARLYNCTLTANSAASSGGGALNSQLNNCIITTNSANSGGGACLSTLNNCVVTANSSSSGGGVYSSILTNCTVTANTAAGGGGACSRTLYNCIIYYNNAGENPNYLGGTLSYCCATPLPEGVGNLQSEPQLASGSHLGAGSPCIGAGYSAYTSGADIDGEPWANPPSMGCDEFYAGTVGGLGVSLQAASTNVAVGFDLDFTAKIDGPVSASKWQFGDGTVASNQPCTSHAWSAPGDYTVLLWARNAGNPGGVTAATTVHVVMQPIHYVATNGLGLAPYNSWTTAATNIQDAVDAATVSGALVLVSNGVYATGGRIIRGALTNRVAVNSPLIIQSVNGSAVTVIQGHQASLTTNGDSAIRCVWLTNRAVFNGFTLTNGATRATGDIYTEQSGGGAWCASTTASVLNCVLAGNSAFSNGGGSFSGSLSNCVLTANSASFGGGSYSSALDTCVLTANSAANRGGGTLSGTLSQCVVVSNSAALNGGGAYGGKLENCSLRLNSSAIGGGVCAGEWPYSATLNNCTLMDNTASTAGGGAYSGTLNRCYVVGNSAPSGGGVYGDSWPYPGTINNCTLTANSAYRGGGAFYGRLINCTLTENSASYGGGTYSDTWPYSATLLNCVLTGNSASAQGGGSYASMVYNCTVTANSASVGGGTYGGEVGNCIVVYNSAPASANCYGGFVNYCCLTPLPGSGEGNFTNAPLFVDQTNGNLRLQAASPCINTGLNDYVSTATDLDNNSRILDGTVEVGAYEYHTTISVLPSAWLLQYGLPTDSSADFVDTDQDGMSNWQEWIAGTNPTDTASVLRILSATSAAPGVSISWLGVTNRTYSLERSGNLAAFPAFSLLQGNLPGLNGITTFLDTTATNSGPYLYRVRVEQ